MSLPPHPPGCSPGTLAIHADVSLNRLTDVAPPIHTSTTFRYSRDASSLQPASTDDSLEPNHEAPLCYSRIASASTNRLEKVLAALLFLPSLPVDGEEEAKTKLQELGSHVVVYSSGLSAFHALLVNVVPKVIAISGGYQGCHGVIALHAKMHGLRTVELGDDKAWDDAGLGSGDLVHVETPLNPTGEAVNIAHFAERAHQRRALLSVDATFAPPHLQDPFRWGADVVVHSGTKYIGGHSDMLCGVLATREGPDGKERARVLRTERVFRGGVLGSLEGWLGVRSLRTLELRIRRQSENATYLVSWLENCLAGASTGEEAGIIKSAVSQIKHASLQTADKHWLERQMPFGYGPVFAVYMRTSKMARLLPSSLRLFQHATSLGGVESLVEWRRMSDTRADERLVRVSVGIEAAEDLKQDLLRGLGAVQDRQLADN